MTIMSIRDACLFVEVIGQGYPMVLMHGGPGSDHNTMSPFRACADRFTLVFYDHRCNGRSEGADLSSMTWDNLTADAEALREALGFDKWAVLGHSFGGMVALEYALRYPQSLSHLLLLDTCGDTWWARQNAPEILAKRGFRPATVETARRFYTGQIEPGDYLPSMLRLARAFYHRLSPLVLARDMAVGLRIKSQPDTYIYAARHLLKDWSVMDRLGEIQVPTLVLAGRDDFQFPPEHQAELAAGIPNAHLEIIERAGHNAPTERSAEVIETVKNFMSSTETRTHSRRDSL